MCDAFLQTMDQLETDGETDTDSAEVDKSPEPELDVDENDPLAIPAPQIPPVDPKPDREGRTTTDIEAQDFGKDHQFDGAITRIETKSAQVDQKFLDITGFEASMDHAVAPNDGPEKGPPVSLERTIVRSEVVPKIVPNTTEAQVVKQVLSAPLSDGNVTEIALDPEELGRVRMQMITHETSVQIVIAVERPETVDLMRKHLDLLTNEFKELGFGDVSLDFASHDDTDDSRQGTSHGKAETQTTEIIQPVLRASDGRVDIRL
ncbi:hypothetical protein BVC71_07960 [Marivivens niveibacter]|uniref:Flagellar hook-length control protein-like C-terminal domain-containing protein n=2 Tax=Marivivens niveibacter TaxID=1930667 RepID=A0A251X0B7_9RHOB|nr:hypothetical protein BVC71_07960 [Marivivens niveibacter]